MQYLYIDGYTYRIWAESSLLCTCTHSRIGKLQVISIVVACSLAWIISFSVVLYETHSRLMGAFIVLFLLLFFLTSSFSSSLSCYLLQLQRERGKNAFARKKHTRFIWAMLRAFMYTIKWCYFFDPSLIFYILKQKGKKIEAILMNIELKLCFRVHSTCEYYLCIHASLLYIDAWAWDLIYVYSTFIFRIFFFSRFFVSFLNARVLTLCSIAAITTESNRKWTKENNNSQQIIEREKSRTIIYNTK